MDIYYIMMQIESDLMDYKELEKEFENKGYELIGIKYIELEPFFLVRKIK